MELKKLVDSKSKEERDMIERMEQMRLAEELAAQREAYLKEKQQRQTDLKMALDTQVKNKPAELPKVLPDGEVFGSLDAKNEKLAEMRRREVDTFNYHKRLIDERKRDDLLRAVKEQEQDAENLERIKEDFRSDRASRHKRMLEMRKNLEKDWMVAFDAKKFRDMDEIKHRLEHDGFLVHEQCDKYKRCAQCTRDLKNCGESSVWKDQRYAAGNRIFV